MTERNWSIELRTKAAFCQDVLKDGRSFTWFKEFDARANRRAYWFQIGQKENISAFDFLTVTDRSGMVIESASFTGGEGNIKILYSADGLVQSIVTTEDYASPWECSAVYDILAQEHEVYKNIEYNYQQVDLSPQPWQRLVAFSPSTWGNSGKVEQITELTEAIIRAKIKPLAF